MADTSIEVFAIGSQVVVDGDIPATIMAFEVRGTVNLVTYQCAWWSERERKSEWLTEDEIKPKDPIRHARIVVR